MYISICLYSRWVACREGRHLHIHVYQYMFMTPVRRAPAGGGGRSVQPTTVTVRGSERRYVSELLLFDLGVRLIRLELGEYI
jgi:hypothetical protein